MKKVVWGRRGVLVGTVALAGWTATGCASTGAVPRPFPAPHADAPAAPSNPAAVTPTEHGTLDGYALVGTALALRGTPYRSGGSDPSGFDCSGFTRYVFGQFGMTLPRDVREQFQAGTPVDADALSPGDLVFFSTVAPGASHVAIAIGGDEFVHAPSSTGVVRVEHLSSSYWQPRYVGARRLN